MKRIVHLMVICLLVTVPSVVAQEIDRVKSLFDEGVSLHDQGKYDEAISKYDQALEMDPENISLMAEKAYSLLSSERYEESIKLCEKAIKTDPESESLQFVYTTYANALDISGNGKKAIKIYDKGIKKFPEYYQLHFNKGIALAGMKKYDEALQSFEISVALNPEHASSHNAIGRLSLLKENKIPALLALSRFLVIEPNSQRATSNFPLLRDIMRGNAEQKDDNKVTININSSLFDSMGKDVENDFSSIELILSMAAAMDYETENENKTEVELFVKKMETLCASLTENKEKNHGFYWDHYAPYFIDLKKKDFIETFSYVVHAASGDEQVGKWLETNVDKINSFYFWSDNYSWTEK